MKPILIDGGYIESGVYYFYLTDHLGNNRVVAKADGTLIQRNHYYPFGMTFAETPLAEQKLQPYKYNNKEYDSMHGLNLYDYSARWKADWYLPTVDPLAEMYYSISPYAYCNNNPLRYIDPTGEAWRPTYDENNDGTLTCNGYEWVEEKDSYDTKGNLLAGLYAQAIFFSDNGTFDASNNNNVSSSTATVYLADGTTQAFSASTNPSDPGIFATVPEGIYHATVGIHNGTKSSYPALKMKDTGAQSQTTELGTTNPAYSDGRTYAEGIDIHKAGKENFTGTFNKGKNGVSQGCLLIDINKWSDFIGIFNNSAQRKNTVGITISRTLAKPINTNRLPAFNFILSGARYNFLNLKK